MQTDNLTEQRIAEAKGGSELCCTDLLADGWREYPDQFKKYARCFYKRFDTPTRCAGNYDKPGVQIQISVSELDGWLTMEMDLCAGLKDETWLTIKNYSLPKTVKEVTALIPRMLAVWESANEKLTDPRRQRAASGKERMNEAKTLSAERGADSGAAPCSARALIDYPIPLSEITAHIMLPADLKTVEADRIHDIMISLCVDSPNNGAKP